MSRCFKILGLSENATKLQVQDAYERKAARYKGPDYAEEPEYVHKKLAELKAAYEEAYRLAGTEDSSGHIPVLRGADTQSRKSESGAKASTAKSSKLRHAERGEPERGFGETFHQWMKRRDEDKARKNNKSVKKERHKKTPGGEAIFKLVAALIAAVIALSGACEGEDIIYDDEYDTAYDYLYNYEEIADSDSKISSIASSANSLLYEAGEESSFLLSDEEPLDYMDQADQFAKCYWDMGSLDKVTDYLYDAYAEYPISSQESADVQLECIFAFYGFLPMEEAAWYENPYTGGQISGYADYLHYLNQYYDEIN